MGNTTLNLKENIIIKEKVLTNLSALGKNKIFKKLVNEKWKIYIYLQSDDREKYGKKDEQNMH